MHKQPSTSNMNHHPYTCPMHPEVVSNTPGKCPKCGMDLVPMQDTAGHAHSHHTHGHQYGHDEASPTDPHSHEMHGHHDGHVGHGDHAGMLGDFRRRFYVVLLLTIPIMALSPMIQQWLSVDWSFSGS